jgi:DNA-binding GntR family transcriptional regulator
VIQETVSPLTEPAALSERVYHAILKLLAQGELAAALKVSPTPVREALARLEATGLVVRQQRRGYRVPPPLDLEQVRGLMDARELIEVACIIHASEHGGDEFVADLSSAVQAQRAAVEAYQISSAVGRSVGGQSFWGVIEADLHFHTTILNHVGNSFLTLMANALQGQQHRVRQSTEQGISDAVDALEEHEAILAAVTTRSTETIAAAMRTHLHLVGQRAEAAAQ